MGRFYISTAIVYTNAPPHIGFALELVQADVIARYRRQMGDEVYFLTGTDEHGTKIARSAEQNGQKPQDFVDGIARQVVSLARGLGISNDDFIRTSDRERHWPSVQKIWKRLEESGDLYKKTYEGLYCVGHEAFIKPSELQDGRCPIHKTEPERISEENWFFRLSKYRDRVKEAIESDRMRIVPSFRRQEILNLLDDAEDVSFSRPSDQLSWGIPVPDDETQTMYVWADALTNYISAPGYADESEQFRAFWPADVHLIGKDILRFHAMIWPAMLMSAGLELPKAVYVHGFITVEGEKMSKSLGNVVDPDVLLERYGSEVARFYLLRSIPSTEDGDFSWDGLKARYESDLANALGNLVRRVSTLIESKMGGKATYRRSLDKMVPELAGILDDVAYHEAMGQFRLHDALARTWEKVDNVNAYLNDKAPWKDDTGSSEEVLTVAAAMIGHVAWLLAPFMPGTAQVIADTFGTALGAWEDGTELVVKVGDPLFPRLS